MIIYSHSKTLLRIILTYNEYKGNVAWRGNSRNVVTKIELDSLRPTDNPYKNDEASKDKDTKD